MKLTLQTLTPLWTGSTDPKSMDRVHETGIVGSLRWWYEAVLRGLVGTGLHRERVCNPTGDAALRCNYEKQNWVCRACDLFGATGWKRRFRMEINGGTYLFTIPANINIKIGTNPWNRGWYFYPPFIADSNHRIIGQVTVLRQRKWDDAPDLIQGNLEVAKRRRSDVENDIRAIAELINRWGGLGPKTQHGWGIVNLQFDNQSPLDVEAFLHGLPNDNTSDQGLPTIGNMFFARLFLKDGIADNWWKNANLGSGVKDQAAAWKLEDNAKAKTSFSVPSAPAVKYMLRYGNSGGTYFPEASKCEEFFFGEINDPAVKAKLNVSNAYKLNGQWQFRIWGWIPEQNIPGGAMRNQLMTELHDVITSDQAFWDGIFGSGVINLGKSVWREVDRSKHGRNTKEANGSTVAPITSAQLLHCLLKREETQK